MDFKEWERVPARFRTHMAAREHLPWALREAPKGCINLDNPWAKEVESSLGTLEEKAGLVPRMEAPTREEKEQKAHTPPRISIIVRDVASQDIPGETVPKKENPCVLYELFVDLSSLSEELDGKIEVRAVINWGFPGFKDENGRFFLRYLKKQGNDGYYLEEWKKDFESFVKKAKELNINYDSNLQ